MYVVHILYYKCEICSCLWFPLSHFLNDNDKTYWKIVRTKIISIIIHRIKLFKNNIYFIIETFSSNILWIFSWREIWKTIRFLENTILFCLIIWSMNETPCDWKTNFTAQDENFSPTLTVFNAHLVKKHDFNYYHSWISERIKVGFTGFFYLNWFRGNELDILLESTIKHNL